MFFSWSAAFFTLGIIQYATEIGGLLLTSSDPASILVAIQIRNKAHILPYFFSYLSNQNYPKDRIALHIRSDHNEDRSVEITQKWIDKHKEEYADISFKYRRFPTTYENEESPQSWPNERTKTLMMLREEALISGLKKGFDYLLMLDADVLLSNSSFLQGLLEAQKPIIAPLIFSYNGYLNFEIQASQIQEDLMTMAQEALAKGDVRGIFPVTQVKHCILIDLKNPKAGRLTFDSTRLIGDYSQYGEDIFSASAWENGIDMFLDNRILTSIMPPPLRSDEQLDDDQQRTLAAVSYASGTEWHYVYEDDIFKEDQIMEDQSNLGLEKVRNSETGVCKKQGYCKMKVLLLSFFAEVFVINLARRPEKKARLAKLLPTLGWEPTFVSAIDGKNLDLENLVRKGIVPMDDYIDRYNHRKMTMGEIGCVLSHYLIWKEIVDNGYEMALILEDDVSFEPYSKRVIRKSLGELKENNISWDLLYVGRQPRRKDNRPDFEETWVTPYVVKSGYSYWLLAYILTLEGAKKLVNTSILEQLIPSDEYVPVMSDVYVAACAVAHVPHAL
ncbi:unnamed protein product [Cyprideis torosa]|uniref:Glycosyl transferase family 25 domain-containing protein n=1 Tax=Cyprideis torosa TaxID=163714 RepID=A0A7R8ZPG9_9CRUS|nr:unnamed protein product [Cyprideis torosa]CAG0893908.1 unnamed protein product [Cyprideis torosa]